MANDVIKMAKNVKKIKHPMKKGMPEKTINIVRLPRRSLPPKPKS